MLWDLGKIEGQLCEPSWPSTWTLVLPEDLVYGGLIGSVRLMRPRMGTYFQSYLSVSILS
jgi:hypothetical protein